jgi:hypothetical protein
MFRFLNAQWRRFWAWSFPSKASVLGLLLAIALLPTYFIDLKSVVSRWLWPPKPHHIPNVSVLIKNTGNTGAQLSYRGRFFIWLPGEGAYHFAGTYEIVAANNHPVEPGMLDIPAGGATKISAKILNEENLYSYLERQDCELTLFFRRADGSMFDSGEMPFKESDLRAYYASADIAQK